MRTRIKICCIASTEEATMAIQFGVDALGLVGKMPSGPGPIEDDLIATIVDSIPPPIASFLLTSEQSAAQIIAHAQRTNSNTIQIVDELSEGTYLAIKEALPAIKLVQVIHVTDESCIDEALNIAPLVDALLLDSGNPKATLKTLGGTGNVHNWAFSRQIVECVTVPVYLAGGLNPLNVQKAIAVVKPFAVDVCSGVRTDGKLDPLKLAAFIAAVNTVELNTSEI